MANPQESECKIAVGDAEYTLKYNWKSLCSIEAATGLALGELGAKAGSATNMRTLLHEGLRAMHPEVTLEGAGNLIAMMGGLGPMLPVLQAALRLAFPDVSLEQNPNPPQPAE